MDSQFWEHDRPLPQEINSDHLSTWCPYCHNVNFASYRIPSIYHKLVDCVTGLARNQWTKKRFTFLVSSVLRICHERDDRGKTLYTECVWSALSVDDIKVGNCCLVWLQVIINIWCLNSSAERLHEHLSRRLWIEILPWILSIIFF